MPCYCPLTAWRSNSLNPNTGKRGITFTASEAYTDLPSISVPCGQCTGCRLDRARQWATRCMHESQLHEENCFITLTYANENLPSGGTLIKKDFQDFMKRLRKQIAPKKVRYFHSGEYGEKFRRPHYHALIFGHDFDDKRLHTIQNDQRIYTSQKLEKLWPYGFSTIGTITFESAAYVARYCMKKVNGPLAEREDEHGLTYYQNFCQYTGEIIDMQSEYSTMSRRPGIAAKWLEQNLTDVYPKDFITINRGQKVRPPKFYDSMYEKIYPSDFRKLKLARIKAAVPYKENNTDSRLIVRQECKERQLKKLVRNYEND